MTSLQLEVTFNFDEGAFTSISDNGGSLVVEDPPVFIDSISPIEDAIVSIVHTDPSRLLICDISEEVR